VGPQEFGFAHSSSGDFLWHSSDDVFYLTTVLKNGWVVDSAYVLVPYRSSEYGGSSNAYAAESRMGTPSLYIKVHWFTDPFTSVQYVPILRIKGPLGVPYQ